MRNEMMHRPIINEDILDYIRSKNQLTGSLGELEKMANEKGIPIIPHETVGFMRVLINQQQPKNVLEIGTAIGFSAALMASLMPIDGHVTTIDRFPEMQERAQNNFRRLDLLNKITLLKGDAAAVLPTLKGEFDLIFMDSAKAKYIEFLPECLRLLKPGKMLLIDDVLQGGSILKPISEIKHRNHAIYRNLNALLDQVEKDPDLMSSLLPLGDGLLMITKDPTANEK